LLQAKGMVRAIIWQDWLNFFVIAYVNSLTVIAGVKPLEFLQRQKDSFGFFVAYTGNFFDLFLRS
jgi:hypothetical protein